MDQHQPFLKAILADRHDDLPRLVYADWLEETGNPDYAARAHFIRTQIRLEAVDPATAEYDELKALETRLLDYYLDDWRFELPEFAWYGSQVDAVQWRRGFADDLGPMTERQFTEHGAAALVGYPLTSVQLVERTEPLAFERFPAFAHVTRLRLGPACHPLYSPPVQDDVSTVTFDSLMTARVFTSLRHLDLSENGITDAWLVRFAAALPSASFAPTLESLDLTQNYLLTDAGANVLATSPAFAGLKQLRVRDTDISPSGRTMLRKRFGPRLM